MRTRDGDSCNMGRCVRDERGAEVVEFIGLFPLVLLALAIAWQVMLAGYTGVTAAGAAREGARAAAVGEDVGRAVATGSPGFDGRRSWTVSNPCRGSAGNPVSVTVRLKVPQIALPFLGTLDVLPPVTAAATMRCEPFQTS